LEKLKHSKKVPAKKVYMMMSGGVDSSVAASVLVSQGYDVYGVFMKCWSLEALEKLSVSQDLYGCFWEDDVQDASLVAGKIGIPFEIWDLQGEYRKNVVDYMLQEYRVGRTPNPDVMCNSTIKFGVFYEKAMEKSADFVATGHYARIVNGQIARGLDEKKDQSYFLWGIEQGKLDHVLFPVGEFESKAGVREYAQKNDLITASKPDSQGLCFIGSTPLRELLLQTLGEKKGDIATVDNTGKKIILGSHPGAYLYTIGQREKLGLSGGPWFVTGIDVDSNEVIVANEKSIKNLYNQYLTASNINWQVEPKSEIISCQAQTRYHQLPEDCEVEIISKTEIKVSFLNPVRAIASGQSIVFYLDDLMLGGAIIN